MALGTRPWLESRHMNSKMVHLMAEISDLPSSTIIMVPQMTLLGMVQEQGHRKIKSLSTS